jgi:hypothetical protein
MSIIRRPLYMASYKGDDPEAAERFVARRRTNMNTIERIKRLPDSEIVTQSCRVSTLELKALAESHERIIKAWRIEGRNPQYHREMKEMLRRKWPMLARAIEEAEKL